jgi:hypothetical protein
MPRSLRNSGKFATGGLLAHRARVVDYEQDGFRAAGAAVVVTGRT